ncbi:MAG TPA: mannose-1-phosphate guanylyltransferase [Flavobacteriales bacterium]|nr:mannose-1-phosphate guanylyltransferase [Flavobacteriales bacterium]HIA10574.1 mannose-1-phosphate guanylyltransferase [Flavobacteriales bacterium]HIO72232.1 mannose-1-phosphate guanylyltransferase [Flavobacteriales bacterium]
MNKDTYCIIMAGGIGSRFWPMSTTAKPKQFLDILGTGTSLMQQTYDRFTSICPAENIFIITNDLYRQQVQDQLNVNDFQIICEPSRRNTAPCIAYGSYKIAELNPNANIIVAPSDHLILKEKAFQETIDSAIRKTVQAECLITLGIKPSRPDTGYGYIQFDGQDENSEDNVRKVKTFTEKPDHQLAQQFLDSGDFYWNSGIFVWTAQSILKAIATHLPEVNSLFKEGEGKYNTPQESDFIRGVYERCKNISIDYGVMEKADNVYVVLSEFGWSDLGTWGSLYDNLEKTKDDNVVVGDKIHMFDSKNCMVNVPQDKLIVLQGLDDYIVVEANNTLLICKKEDEQKIKQMVSDIYTKE